MTFEDDKAQQIAAITRYLGSDAPDQAVLVDLYDDAVQVVMDYTGRTEASMTHSLMIAAKRLAIVYCNQQGDEGESSRTEGGVARTFEVGIPGSIRQAIAPYRLGKTRRFS